MNFLLNVSQDVFDNFLHEDTVVSFSSHAGVRRNYSFRNAGTAKETTATGTLTADCCHLLEMPSCHGFNSTERTNLSVFFAFWVLKEVLSLVIAHVENDCTSQHW